MSTPKVTIRKFLNQYRVEVDGKLNWSTPYASEAAAIARRLQGVTTLDVYQLAYEMDFSTLAAREAEVDAPACIHCGKPAVSPHEQTCGSDACLKAVYP